MLYVKDGLKPDPDKVQGITEMTKPIQQAICKAASQHVELLA